jgi:hypothetical protein
MARLNILLTRLAVALTFFLLSATAQQFEPSTSASIYAGNKKWEYHGCFNETVGVEGTGGARALAGSQQTKSDTLTVEGCFDICNAKGAQFAGLEYTKYVILCAVLLLAILFAL